MRAERRVAAGGNVRGPVTRLLPFLGPAFVAAVAYIDPGNFATNTIAGARHGYALLWVVLLSNIMAVFVQTMSAKLGIATGRNLPEVCREYFPKPVTIGLWLQAEVVAIATDLAEFIGGALGLHLLFGIPLFPAALIIGIFSFALLELQRRGFRSLEAAVACLVGIVMLSFAYVLFVSQPAWRLVAGGLFVPSLPGDDSLLLAAGILGATVMPHVIYLHSALTQHRIVGHTAAERRRVFRYELVDVLLAMAIAGAINIAMVVTAAALFAHTGSPASPIEGTFSRLHEQGGAFAGLLFGVALLASGFASSAVGTLSGQVVMQGYINRRVPIYLRRIATMLPALAILWFGLDAGTALLFSQVVLSFGIPFALVPMLVFCSNRRLMGDLVNRPVTTGIVWCIAVTIIFVNVYLLYQLVLGWI